MKLSYHFENAWCSSPHPHKIPKLEVPSCRCKKSSEKSAFCVRETLAYVIVFSEEGEYEDSATIHATQRFCFLFSILRKYSEYSYASLRKDALNFKVFERC